MHFKEIKGRPLPVVLVSVLFMLVGCVGFFYHLGELSQPDRSPGETGWVLFVRILAVACGWFLLFGTNWARWLAIAWLAYHVVISTFHSTPQVLAHLAFLVVVSTLLFLPVSSAYFRNGKKQ